MRMKTENDFIGCKLQEAGYFILPGLGKGERWHHMCIKDLRASKNEGLSLLSFSSRKQSCRSGSLWTMHGEGNMMEWSHDNALLSSPSSYL